MLVIGSFAACAKQGSNETQDPIIQTVYGQVQGFVIDGVTVFKGIPFAAPPVGNLRFAPPQPIEPWEGILDCTKFKESAMQKNKGLSEMSEDCLYLNIWTPEDAVGKKLPVLVYIHGGGYANGSPANSTYEGTRFAKDGVIQVNVAYRLNVFGFIADQEIEAQYGYLGNAGMLDQVASLKWVKENIESFGGDPDNITISGESAGSFSVSTLIESPLAKGLFNRAILESGNLLGQQMVSSKANGSVEQALVAKDSFYQKLNVKSLAEIQALSAQVISETAPYSSDMSAPTQNFWPIFDGKAIPSDPYKALVNGDINAVDILGGYNSDEGTMFITHEIDELTYSEFVESLFGTEKARAVLDRYPVNEDYTPTERAHFIIEMGIRFGTDVFANELTKQGHNAYLYNFDYMFPELEKKGLGTAHGIELIFVFDTLPSNIKLTDDLIAFKEQVHTYWLNFIKNGDPNQGDSVAIEWPKYDAETKMTLKLNNNIKAIPAEEVEDIEFFTHLLWDED